MELEEQPPQTLTHKSCPICGEPYYHINHEWGCPHDEFIVFVARVPYVIAVTDYSKLEYSSYRLNNEGDIFKDTTYIDEWITSHLSPMPPPNPDFPDVREDPQTMTDSNVNEAYLALFPEEHFDLPFDSPSSDDLANDDIQLADDTLTTPFDYFDEHPEEDPFSSVEDDLDDIIASDTLVIDPDLDPLDLNPADLESRELLLNLNPDSLEEEEDGFSDPDACFGMQLEPTVEDVLLYEDELQRQLEGLMEEYLMAHTKGELVNLVFALGQQLDPLT